MLASKQPADDFCDVIAVYKGRERWIFIYDAACVQDLYATFLRFAADPAYSFSYFDLTQAKARVRRVLRENAEAQS